MTQKSNEFQFITFAEETTMYHIKAWKRVEQALTACAEPFVAAGRELGEEHYP